MFITYLYITIILIHKYILRKVLLMKDKIINYFKENREQITKDIIDLLSEMVEKKTVNVISEKLSDHPYLSGRGDEYLVGDIVKREFDKWGIKYEVFSRDEKRPNIIGSIGSGKSGKILFMPAHMDVVPSGDGWDTDPFKAVVKGDKIFGRGTLDNKGPLVASMYAGKIMKDVLGEDNVPGILQIAALSDEEAADPDGVDYGIEFLLEEKHIAPTYAIIPDIGYNMEQIEIAEKGRIVFKVTSKGKQAHGSTPELGINAIYPMARFLALLEDIKLEAEHDPTFDTQTTVNLGEVHGGAAPNIVPNSCSALIDIRSMPGQTEEYLKDEIQKLCDKAKGDFVIEILAATKPHKVNPDNSILVKAIKENSKQFLNFEPGLIGFGGGTYGKGLNFAGIESVGYGPGDDTAFHVENEYVSIKQLVDFAMITILVALDLL